ncbi:uncharacterized protein LOC142748519 [Rhinoderma darwinii]|uniref:uncharacterized protein LOC142748519 n=1 Tax=Rhinoderma darwinii TaxID=43563 RepID=UPI003F664089
MTQCRKINEDVETSDHAGETDIQKELKILKKMMAGAKKKRARKINAGKTSPEKAETIYRAELSPAPPDYDEESYPWLEETTTEPSYQTTIKTTPAPAAIQKLKVRLAAARKMAAKMKTTAAHTAAAIRAPNIRTTTAHTAAVITASPATQQDLAATASITDDSLRKILIISGAVGVPLLLVAALLVLLLVKLHNIQKLLERESV